MCEKGRGCSKLTQHLPGRCVSWLNSSTVFSDCGKILFPAIHCKGLLVVSAWSEVKHESN